MCAKIRNFVVCLDIVDKVIVAHADNSVSDEQKRRIKGVFKDEANFMRSMTKEVTKKMMTARAIPCYKV